MHVESILDRGREGKAEFSKIEKFKEIQGRIMKDEANNVSRDHSMEGLISRGKEVGLYPENKGKSL